MKLLCIKQFDFKLIFYLYPRLIVNNFTIKMKSSKDYLFTLELRIRKQIIKINVYQSDSLNDLFLKLASKVQLKEKHSEILRQKLETNLKRMANSPTSSQKVRNKLEALTEQTKIVILGLTQDEGTDRSLNETPFNILVETSLNMHKHYSDKNKRNYLFDNSSAFLKRNYNKPTSQIIYQNQETENNQLHFKYTANDTNIYSLRPQEGYEPQSSSRSRYQSGFARKDYPHKMTNARPTLSNHNEYGYKFQMDFMNQVQNAKNNPNIQSYDHQQSFKNYQNQKNKAQPINRQLSAQNLRRKHSSNQIDIPIPKNYNNLNYYPYQNIAKACTDAHVSHSNGFPIKKFSYLQEFDV